MRLDFVSIFKAEDQNGIDRGRHFRWNITDVANLQFCCTALEYGREAKMTALNTIN